MTQDTGRVSRTIDLHDLTPSELALLFAELGSDEQAAFFDEVGRLSDEWPGLGWCGQCSYIADTLTLRALRVIETLNGHAQEKAA